MDIEKRTGGGIDWIALWILFSGGLVTCVILLAGAGLVASAKGAIRPRPNRQAFWIVASAVVAFLSCLSKLGSVAGPRLVAAYYPLLIAGVLVLVAADGRLLRYRFLKIVGSAAMLSAIPLVVLSRARPLFPVDLVARYLARFSPSAVVRFNQVYQVYSSRYDALKDLRAYLPENERVVGLLQGGDAPETSLWRPFGAREVLEVTPEESADELNRQHLHFIIVEDDALQETNPRPIDELIQKWGARVVAESHVAIKATWGLRTWYVLSRP